MPCGQLQEPDATLGTEYGEWLIGAEVNNYYNVSSENYYDKPIPIRINDDMSDDDTIVWSNCKYINEENKADMEIMCNISRNSIPAFIQNSIPIHHISRKNTFPMNQPIIGK